MPSRTRTELLGSVLAVSFVQDRLLPLENVRHEIVIWWGKRTCVYWFPGSLPLFDQVEKLPSHNGARV